MSKTRKPIITPPPTKLGLPLLITLIAFVIIGAVLIVFGKVIIAGIIALFGAVFGLSAQVKQNNKF